MKTSRALWIGVAAAVLVLCFGLSVPLGAQSKGAPVPGVEAAKDIPGAHELPDPKVDYKVLLDIGNRPKDFEKVNSGLRWASQYYNTLVKYGVPADHLKVAVLLHGPIANTLLNNDAFKAKFNGQDNPNIELIQNMKKAGIDIHVCGQSVLNLKIDPKTLLPEVELDLWALTTKINMGLRGYVVVPEPPDM